MLRIAKDVKVDGTKDIIGGKPLPRDKRPYLISLGIDYPEYFHFCGATLIAPSVVLTAAREYSKEDHTLFLCQASN